MEASCSGLSSNPAQLWGQVPAQKGCRGHLTISFAPEFCQQESLNFQKCGFVFTSEVAAQAPNEWIPLIISEKGGLVRGSAFYYGYCCQIISNCVTRCLSKELFVV